MPEASCILVVGSTGSGKSTLIGLCTGAEVKTSSETGECTLEISEFKEVGKEDGPSWIDSVGFDGTNIERTNKEAFQYILRFLQEKNISHMVGIIWTVNPDNRESAQLQDQAKLINEFKEVKVWDNVMVLVKRTRGAPRQDAAGALAAAKGVAPTIDVDRINVIGFSLLEELDEREMAFWSKQNIDDRNKMGIKTREEASQLVKETLRILPSPMQVVFNNNKCLDCGVSSDPRLLPLLCHTNKENVHPQSLVPFHRGGSNLVHPVQNLSRRHTGSVDQDKVRIGGNRVTGRRYKYVPFMTCCKNDPSHAGCQEYYTCCAQPKGSNGCKNVYTCCGAPVMEGNSGCGRRFPCCGMEEGADGCTAQCSHCKTTWGQWDSIKSCIGTNHKNVIKL